LGDSLGKGAFGSVYKALNLGTGEAVAIKQIKLGDLPRSELRMIEVGWIIMKSWLLRADILDIGRNRFAEEPQS